MFGGEEVMQSRCMVLAFPKIADALPPNFAVQIKSFSTLCHFFSNRVVRYIWHKKCGSALFLHFFASPLNSLTWDKTPD